MLNSAVRNKIDKIWTDIWAGGITNPITVIEQLTYLMFIRSLDEREAETVKLHKMGDKSRKLIFPQIPEGQAMRWSVFKNRDAREIFEIVQTKVFPFIKDLNGNSQTAFTRYMKDAIFLIPTEQLLQKIITGLDELYEHEIKDLDMQGDLYEYMLSKLSTAGQNGQFRTPKHIRDMMVGLLDITPKDRLCDPACGTAGFLVSAAEYVRKNYENQMTSADWEHFGSDMFSGFEMDATMLRISAMNLMLHSIENPHIEYYDSLSKHNKINSAYTAILANPPFTGSIDKESINADLKVIAPTTKTELLFVALFMRMLEKGGRCACIVPDGVLFGTTKAHQSLRKELVENNQLQAVISMPSGVFKPYAGVSTAVLVFVKAGRTDDVWFYNMEADGFSLDDKRNKIDADDIPDILARFKTLDNEKSRKRTDKSFMVPKAEIAGNGYDLSINRYMEQIYEKVEYDAPYVVLDRLDSLNAEITQKTKELRGLIDG